jgi:anti-sigma regulatory factor (Ser/Thr protein kinase)
MGTRSHYKPERGTQPGSSAGWGGHTFPAPPGNRLCGSAPADRAARIDLAAVPESAAAARRHARDTLARWGMTELTDDAQAIATELVSNAIAAVKADAEHPVMLTLHDRPPELRIHVWDHGPGAPARRTAGAGEENGRGLAIVDTLTSRQWGWYSTPASGGKVVWAALGRDDKKS